MQTGPELFSEAELTIVERYERDALENVDGPTILNLLEGIEDEIRRRGAPEGATDRE